MAEKQDDEIETSDYKLDKKGRKVKAHRIVFRKGEDDGEKQVKEDSMKKTFNSFVQEHTLPLTEEQLNDIVLELQEVLGKDAQAGDWISDFVHSDNPQFAGKSKEKRKQMALAAFYAKQKNEAVELKGGQVKLDKNKNGKLDAEDFKKLRKEETIDEELHPEADKVLKHIKPEHHAKYKADLAKGVYKGDFADRTAVLKAAKNAGHLKEDLDEVDMPLNESYDPADYEASHEKSQFGGHRAKLTNKKTGKVSYLGATGYHKPEHAKGEAEAYRTSYNHSGKSHPGATYSHDKAISAYRKKAKEAGHIAEDNAFHIDKRPSIFMQGTSTKHDVKKISTGTVYTKQRDPNGISKEFKRDPDEAKRGRGRPKKNSFSEAAEFLMSLDEETFDSMMEEGFDSFMETFANLDEVSKVTLGSYIKKATNGMSGVAINAHQAGGATPGSTERKSFLAKANKRIGGIAKAADRLSK